MIDKKNHKRESLFLIFAVWNGLLYANNQIDVLWLRVTTLCMSVAFACLWWLAFRKNVALEREERARRLARMVDENWNSHNQQRVASELEQ